MPLTEPTLPTLPTLPTVSTSPALISEARLTPLGKKAAV